MNRLNIVFFYLLAFFSAQIVYSQGERTGKKLEGTYQIQMVNTRMQPAVPLDLIQEIPEKRKKEERVTISVSEHVRILIYSEDEINAPQFVAPKKFVYVVE